MQSHSVASSSASNSTHSNSAAVGARIEALRVRHEALSNKISMEQSRPGSSDWYLRALKTQKLHLKEEIESLLSTTSH